MTNKNEDKGLEADIFTWEGWDQHDTMAFGFTDCVMLRDFGPLKKGEKYEAIDINYDRSRIDACPVGAHSLNDGELDESKVISFKIKLEPA